MREIDGVWVYLIPEKEPMEKDGKQYLRWSFRIGRRQPSKSRPSKDFITNAQIRAAIEEDRASLGLEKPRYGKIVDWITVEYDPATRTATWKQYNPLAREEDRNDAFRGKGIAQAFDDFVMGKAKKSGLA
ncbi:MAG: hypothetical protein NT067_07355 [Candidatus Diapherotrites archaeon]|nr:hypothetical protein [Candidatus Diapherotrites archaeon]